MNSIDLFYQNNKVNPNFDENFYQKRYPETKEFYQPHCRILNIDDKHRLYYHWFLYADKSDQQSIEYFYATHTLIDDFDVDFYTRNYPDTKNFYQPYCRNQNIDDKRRLYFHWHLSKSKRFKSPEDMQKHFFLFEKDHDVRIANSVCVIVHVYFFDVWQKEIAPEIKNLNLRFDLYISLTEGGGFENKKDEILKDFPNATIVSVPNRGADVGPFFKILKTISDTGCKYEYLLKLHTKKSVHLSEDWSLCFRLHFYKNLCRNLDYCIDLMNKNKSIAMIGPPNSMVELSNSEDEKNLMKFKELVKRFELKDDSINFIAGTMFVCRFELLSKYFKDISIYEFETGHKTDGTLAHSFERIFSNIVRSENQKIYCLGEKYDCN